MKASRFDPRKPDASCDLDGTLLKFTTLVEYTEWLSSNGIFAPLPKEIQEAKRAWKRENNETNYNLHIGQIVAFFVDQVSGKSITDLKAYAKIVAAQNRERRWDVMRNILLRLQPSHNLIAISHMPEWLIEPFVEDLGFAATAGSIYVEQEGILTGEAYIVPKDEAYSSLRDGDVGKLDYYFGDTIADMPILGLAKRPVAINPSHTLTVAGSSKVTTISANKDLVYVLQPSETTETIGAWFRCDEVDAILTKVAKANPS